MSLVVFNKLLHGAKLPKGSNHFIVIEPPLDDKVLDPPLVVLEGESQLILTRSTLSDQEAVSRIGEHLCFAFGSGKFPVEPAELVEF